jgi:hypothetical protein
VKDSELKAILLGLLSAVENLQTNLVLLSACVPNPPTIADAQDAKIAASKLTASQSSALRKKIEALPG